MATPDPERIEVPIGADEDPSVILQAAMEPYEAAQKEYRRLNGGHMLFEFQQTYEIDPVLGEVPVIVITKARIDTVEGRVFEPFHELVLVSAEDGTRLRTENQIAKEVSRNRQFMHDKMADHLEKKKNFLRVNRQSAKIKRETFVHPEKEAEVAAKIEVGMETELEVQDIAIKTVVNDGK